MFVKLEIPKGARVTHTRGPNGEKARIMVSVTEDEKAATPPIGYTLAEPEAAIYSAIFPLGTIEFPTGLRVPNVRSVKMDIRAGTTVIR